MCVDLVNKDNARIRQCQTVLGLFQRERAIGLVEVPDYIEYQGGNCAISVAELIQRKNHPW